MVNVKVHCSCAFPNIKVMEKRMAILATKKENIWHKDIHDTINLSHILVHDYSFLTIRKMCSHFVHFLHVPTVWSMFHYLLKFGKYSDWTARLFINCEI